jgi:hypothetical protein
MRLHPLGYQQTSLNDAMFASAEKHERTIGLEFGVGPIGHRPNYHPSPASGTAG